MAAPAVRPESAALTVSGSYRIDQRIQGAAAFAPGQTVTGSLPASLESFRATHGTLEEAAEAFREARRVCDAALAESAAAATLPDLGLDGLASKQVGARLGVAQEPVLLLLEPLAVGALGAELCLRTRPTRRQETGFARPEPVERLAGSSCSPKTGIQGCSPSQRPAAAGSKNR